MTGHRNGWLYQGLAQMLQRCHRLQKLVLPQPQQQPDKAQVETSRGQDNLNVFKGIFETNTGSGAQKL
jgi:hypothetical protein